MIDVLPEQGELRRLATAVPIIDAFVDAKVAPAVPPKTIRIDGMFMNAIGFPPSIKTASRRIPTVPPIPMAVMAFIKLRSFGSFLAALLGHGESARQDPSCRFLRCSHRRLGAFLELFLARSYAPGG